MNESPEVVAQLVASHARFLAFLERRVGDRHVAEEILQQAFVRAVERSHTIREEESATAWFYRLLRNAIVDHRRRRGAEARALEAAAREPEPVMDEALMDGVCQCVHALLPTLADSHADILQHVDLGGEGVAAYARRTGISANNAGVRLHRAREALFKQLVRCCGACATHGCLDCHCDHSMRIQSSEPSRR